MMYLIYEVVFLIYALVYLPYLLLTRRWYAGFGMRFGVFSPLVLKEVSAKANIWVHAVSVGEVMVIDGFIDQLKKLYPDEQVIATVTTRTGYELACERLKHKALVIPSPIDFSFVAARFVSLIKPRLYIGVETEIWPNLYRQLYIKKVPLVVINGRISDASFGRYKAIRWVLKGILNQVSIWCMQSQRDAQRIMALGADPSRVVVTGNIKFDLLKEEQNVSPLFHKERLGEFKENSWWVAGSTHPGEEGIVLDVYSKIISDDPQWRLLIAPRHVERVPEIMGLITRRGFKAVKFSDITAPPAGGGESKVLIPSPLRGGLGRGDLDNAVIVVDTIGHLRSLYSIASLVFVGKSLCVGGGHNIIEPAFYGNAIIIGPRFENFRDIVACFKNEDALIQVEDAKSFETAVRVMCADPLKRQALGKKARAVIAANQGATKRSLEYIGRFRG